MVGLRWLLGSDSPYRSQDNHWCWQGVKGTWRDLEFPGKVTSVGEPFQGLKSKAGKASANEEGREYRSDKGRVAGLSATLVKLSSVAGGSQFIPTGLEFLTLFISFDGNTIRSLWTLPSMCSSRWHQEIAEFIVFKTPGLDYQVPFLNATWLFSAIPSNWVR